MSGFCKSDFWDTFQIWHSSTPDFTPCFEKTVLLILPCIYFWLFAVIEILIIHKSKDRNIPWSWLNISKLVISGIIISTELSLLLANIVIGSQEAETVYGVDYFYPSILIATFCFQVQLILSHRQNGIQSSGFLFGFWLLFLVCGLPPYRTNLIYAIDEYSSSTESSIKAEFITYMILYPCFVVMFLLTCFADKPPKCLFHPRGKNCSPLLNASFLNQITFTWIDGLIWKGSKAPLKQEDLHDLPPNFSSTVILKTWDKMWNRLYTRFKKKQEKKSKSKKFSMLPVLLKTFQYPIIVGMILKLIPDVLMFVSPQLMKLLISFSEDESIAEWKGYFYSVLLFLVTEITSVLNAQQFIVMYSIGLQIRTAVTSAVYRKALKISSSSKKNSTVGEIVNLMAVDVQRFLDLMGYINAMWSAPLQIILCIYFLWRIIGPSAFVGLLVMLVLIPINGMIASRLRILQIFQMKEKDKRVKIINEVLNGIKVLKLYAWEPSFLKQILGIRKKEIESLKSTAYLGAANAFFFTCTPVLVSFFMFLTFVLISSDNVLTPDIVFVSLTLLNILRIPMILLPMILISLVQANVSLNRLNKFMNSEELDPTAVIRNSSKDDPIVIENGAFSWEEKDNENLTLKKINLRVKNKTLVGVVGTVGSGKSSLCSAILGEMEKVSGNVYISGSCAYVSQQAWIQNATVKENILFSKPFDQRFYDEVIEACCLKFDLDLLTNGDQTEIGEKGINISGGQKQRVSLARAVYSNADIYILDDPLSAVDSHVGKDIFERVIGPKGLLKNKTRILVTHGLGFLHEMDEIVVVKNGEISEQGSFADLINKKGDFQEFLMQYLTTQEGEDELEPEVLEEIKTELEKTVGEKTFERQVSHFSEKSETSRKTNTSEMEVRRRGSKMSQKSLTDKNKPQTKSDAGKIIQDETMETGRTSRAVYLYYARSIGLAATSLTIVFYAASQVFSVLGNILLSKWSDNENGAEPKTRNTYLSVYAAFGVAQALSILLGYGILARSSIIGSRMLHDNMLNNVLRSPMAFFDRTPIGRLVNRFAKDVDTTDVLLPMTLRSFFMCLMSVISTFGAIIYATPIFAVVLVPFSVIYFYVQGVYVKTSRQLKRIESVTRSPIYAHFGESIQGAVTIRAFQKQNEFVRQSEMKVDYNQLSYYPSIIIYRWLAVRLEFLGNVLTFFAALFTVMKRGSVTGGDVGLSISYSLSVTQIFNYLVRLTSDVETNIVSVERIKEYTEVPQEAPWLNPSNAPPKSWPEKGVVEFKGYSTRYREDLDFVIKNIDCLINESEKVGIVGRTGAGKSSLTLALFRMIEAARGSILIDGVDISTLGLHDLRKRLTIIPQDPVLFCGTLRMNLDPFEEHSDSSLWDVLEHSHLKEFVSTLTSKLNFQVNEGGENLSVGQRQLICLGRALLRKTKILILDEATAAVDLETDELIQETIRKEFDDCTIITIAHRLNTIMEYTRIIVLDKGELKEFDTPASLLSNPSSLFYGMAKSAGLVDS